jgi:putative hydrolase of the HAD superfamily
MKHSLDISVLFLDIGGVLLTNGWDRKMRQRAAEEFALDLEELNERHNLTFDTYERGLLSLDAYLRRVVFYQDRAFTPEQFKDYMFAQSQPIDDNIEVFKKLAKANGLRVGAINNEGRELAIHRIREFHLTALMDFFITSSFVRFRKPDEDIYRLALDIAQVAPERAVYVEDRRMFVEVAQELGIHSIHYESLEKTLDVLAEMGLKRPPSRPPGRPGHARRHKTKVSLRGSGR